MLVESQLQVRGCANVKRRVSTSEDVHERHLTTMPSSAGLPQLVMSRSPSTRVGTVARSGHHSTAVRTRPATSEAATRLSRVVRKRGFEPLRYYYRQPLKLVRLPVPPLPRGFVLLREPPTVANTGDSRSSAEQSVYATGLRRNNRRGRSDGTPRTCGRLVET